MAIYISPTASGHSPVPEAGSAGVVVTQIATITMNANAATGDIIDLGVLPGGNTITGIRVVADSGITVSSVGILSGEPGNATNDDGTARTIVGSPLYDATNLRATDAALAMGSSDSDQSVGLVLGANATSGQPAAATGQTLRLFLSYAAI